MKFLRRLRHDLTRRLTRCGYCRHIIHEQGPLADANESTGCCDLCRDNEVRRNHFSGKPQHSLHPAALGIAA